MLRPHPSKPTAREPSGQKPSVVTSPTIQHGLATPGTTTPTVRGPREVLVSDSRSLYGMVNVIDQGGMGIVYEARDQRLNRSVALKVMLQTEDKNPELTQRFIEEAQVTSQLEHPNIVPLHELGVDAEGRLFFSMKLVRGETLAARLSRWRETPSNATLIYEAMTIVIKVCDALAFAHSKDVVHRDIKPANIMIGEYGEVLVMDWGIARVLSKTYKSDLVKPTRSPSAQPRAGLDLGSTSLTLDGDVIGTPGYMAPEQARGDIADIDERTDIYSIGAIIYEILAGRRAITGDASEVISRTIEGVIHPPSVVNPQRLIPTELEAVAMKAMSLDKADRYGHVRELAHDLESYLAGRSVSAKRDSFGEVVLKALRRNRHLSMTISIACLVILMISISLFNRIRTQNALRLAAESERNDYQQKERDREHTRLLAFEPYSKAIDLLARSNFASDSVDLLRHAIEIDPQFTEAHYALGQALQEAGDPRAAADEFLEADHLSRSVSNHPNLQALLSAAFAQDDAGLYRQSSRTFADADTLGGNDPLVLVGRCFHLGFENQLAGLLSTATQAALLGPKLWETHFAMGYALVANIEGGVLPPARLHDAQRELRRAVAMAPREIGPKGWLCRLLVHGDEHDRSEAVVLANEVVDSQPRNPAVYSMRGNIEVMMGDISSARLDLDKMIEMNTSSILLTELRAGIAMASGDLQQAFTQQGLELQDFPMVETEESYLECGIYLSQQNQLAQELERFHADNRGTMLDYKLRCGEDLMAKAFAQGVIDADAGLQVAPYAENLLLVKGLFTAANGKPLEGLAQVQKTEVDFPDSLSAGIYVQRLLLGMHRHADAATHYRRLQKRFPEALAIIQKYRDPVAATTAADAASTQASPLKLFVPDGQ